MKLETYIRNQREKKDMLLMTHIVVGYPDFDSSREIVQQMVSAGVDLMELQIPFSEPLADGPVILKANQKALEKGATVRRCLSFAREVAQAYPIAFVVMTYANILFRYGMAGFAQTLADIGVHGAIVPDLPPEEGRDYIEAMGRNACHPIFIVSPKTGADRLKYIASMASGFVYCQARKGVTGDPTVFSEDLSGYLSRCRAVTRLPLAVGFGIREKKEVDFLKGRADMAVIGSETIRVVDAFGPAAVGEFIRSLR